MIKRLIFLVTILMMFAAVAQAGSLVGKIKTISADTLTITGHFQKVKWVKEGQKVKLNRKIKGVIIAARDSMITVVVPKLEKIKMKIKKKIKIGEEVKIAKYRKVLSGC